jgi:predicted dehydrogenase
VGFHSGSARTSACIRLFGAKEQYSDHDEMLAHADIEAVFILTGPGTHAPFAVRAAAAGKHILLQKPMATKLEDANAIVEAVRAAGVKAVIEPSSHTILEAPYREMQDLIRRGVLGGPYFFSTVSVWPDRYHPSLGGNPYGLGAFFSKDSGGMLFDYSYTPTQIVTLLGPCKAVTGTATISVPDRWIVPEEEYDKFLTAATDAHDANYWDAVLDLPKTQHITMGAEDNIWSLYEMENGAIGAFHCGRPFHPSLPGPASAGLQIYGTEGNLIFGGGAMASFISARKGLLPRADADGWYRIQAPGDRSKAVWPKPTPGGFNYYHVSTQHLIDCILDDRDPIINVEFGRHVTEMMTGAIE